MSSVAETLTTYKLLIYFPIRQRRLSCVVTPQIAAIELHREVVVSMRATWSAAKRTFVPHRANATTWRHFLLFQTLILL